MSFALHHVSQFWDWTVDPSLTLSFVAVAAQTAGLRTLQDLHAPEVQYRPPPDAKKRGAVIGSAAKLNAASMLDAKAAKAQEAKAKLEAERRKVCFQHNMGLQSTWQDRCSFWGQFSVQNFIKEEDIDFVQSLEFSVPCKRCNFYLIMVPSRLFLLQWIWRHQYRV